MASALTDEQIERLHLEYAMTGSQSAAARTVGVSISTAHRYLKRDIEDPNSAVAKMRTQKRVDIAARMGEVIEVQLAALAQADKIAKASYQELSTSVGILTDKRLLITGQPTARTETLMADPAAKLTPDEMEAAARIRAKLAAEAS